MVAKELLSSETHAVKVDGLTKFWLQGTDLMYYNGLSHASLNRGLLDGMGFHGTSRQGSQIVGQDIPGGCEQLRGERQFKNRKHLNYFTQQMGTSQFLI